MLGLHEFLYDIHHLGVVVVHVLLLLRVHRTHLLLDLLLADHWFHEHVDQNVLQQVQLLDVVAVDCRYEVCELCGGVGIVVSGELLCLLSKVVHFRLFYAGDKEQVFQKVSQSFDLRGVVEAADLE